MPYRKITRVYYKHHTKHMDTLHKQTAEIFFVKAVRTVGPKVTTMFYTFKIILLKA
jgi:hypothetical protein